MAMVQSSRRFRVAGVWEGEIWLRLEQGQTLDDQQCLLPRRPDEHCQPSGSLAIPCIEERARHARETHAREQRGCFAMKHGRIASIGNAVYGDGPQIDWGYVRDSS